MKPQRIAMSRLSRRRFVQGAGLVGLGLLAGCGQPPSPRPAQAEQFGRTYRVGWVGGGSPTPAGSSPQYEALQDGLRELGYVEGRNLTLAPRYAEGQNDRLSDLISELLSWQPDALVLTSTPASRAAKAATSTIPLVFTAIGDPVGTGLVPSYAHPDGNMTGLTNIAPELSGKRLELLKDAVSAIHRVAAIWNASDPAMAGEFAATRAAAETLGLELESIGVRNQGELAEAYAAAVAWGADAIVMIAEALITQSRGRLVALAAQSGLPTISGDRGFAAEGGLMSYGPDPLQLHRRAAYYLDRILRGTPPADLPVERPMTFDFIINLKTAQALGLTIPQQVLLQATEVIQ